MFVCFATFQALIPRFINHINVNNLLNESQHGFIIKRSCLTNLLQFIETDDYVDHAK